jgi:ABC-type multidrug transport system ATPase subunit/pSer/pThr/pTyr-binding forkhead associated (FHA) protein/ABC-type multidrug transport system permease subunit
MNNSLTEQLKLVKGIIVVTVGRAADNHFIVNESTVSSHHAKFIVSNDSIILEDLNSSNGTFVNGKRIERAQIQSEDVIFLGKRLEFKIEYLNKFINAAISGSNKDNGNDLLNKSLISIGRNDDNDLVINNIKVSRYHAKIIKQDGRWIIEDLNSSNGTFVNGKKIKSREVTENDTILIGGVPFKLSHIFTSSKIVNTELKLSGNYLSYQVDGGKTIVDDISLTIFPGEFVGLIGPAGAGKTTLMMMLNGVIKPTCGEVLINNQSLHANYTAFKGQIGYVPQDDIIHRELKVKESLFYTGKLRLENASDQRINTQVDDLMDTLSLKSAADTLIGSPEKKGISGGQRKRVNMGQELLTEPSILFLDEPTSGLDPKTDMDVMHLLKEISQKGKIVVLTTHNITEENFSILTHIVVLANGGKLAFFGSPREAIEYFNVKKPYEIFTELSKQTSDYWKNKYKESDYYLKYILERKMSLTREVSPGLNNSQRSFGISQYLTLLQRYAKVKIRDRMSTIILLLQAPIIAILIATFFHGDENRHAAIFILTISAIWFGCSNAAREIVNEKSIFRRERMVNLKIPSYILSKITVLTLLCTVQCLILAGIAVPYHNLNGSFGAVFGNLLATSISSLMMGLFISSISKTSEAAMSILPIILIPQIIAAGFVISFNKLGDVLQVIAGFTVSRWAFEAAELHQNDAPFITNMLGFNLNNLTTDYIMLSLFAVVFFILTAIVLKSKDIK